MFSLGLSNDTICQILGVQSSAIRKAKQRIRQKLDLGTNIDLEEFFKIQDNQL